MESATLRGIDKAEEVSLSPMLSVEQCDDTTITVFLNSTGARLRMQRALYGKILAFETPRTIASVTQGDARLELAIDRLRGLGFLVGETDAALVVPPRPVTDPPYRLFDCPAHKSSSGSTDIVVIGVPYDGGDHEAAGARHGPIAIRKTSLQLLYRLDKRTGQPLGWFDADVRRPVLRGVTIGDVGDVVVTSGEPQTQTFARLRDVLESFHGGQRRVWSLVGGDATTSFPLIEVMQARDEVDVLRIGDLEHDASAAQSTFLSIATLASSVLALPRVDRFVQIGTSRPDDVALPGFSAVTASALLDGGGASIEAHLAPGRPIHLGLDMTILASPGDAPADRARIAYTDLRSLLHEIGERYRIVSVDLVGLNPLKGDWGSKSVEAVHLLLAMLDAATNRNGRNMPV